MKYVVFALLAVALAGCAHSPGDGEGHPVPVMTTSSGPLPPPPPPPPPPQDDDARAQAELRARMEAEREAAQRSAAERGAEREAAERAAAMAMAERPASTRRPARRAAAARPASAASADARPQLDAEGEAARAEARGQAAREASAATATDDDRAAAEREALAGREASAIADAADAEAAAGDVPSETDEVDVLLERLRVGNIAFNAPKTVNIEQTVRVRALVSPDEGVATLQARLGDDAPGEQVVAEVKVSKVMEARLTGEGFAIVPITQARQAVGSGVTTWEWDVTPQEEGRHRLTLSLDAFVRVDGESVAKTLRTFNHSIDVEVSTGQRIGGWVEEHGKWAWSTLLVPLFAWWTKKKKGKTESGKD